MLNQYNNDEMAYAKQERERDKGRKRQLNEVAQWEISTEKLTETHTHIHYA